MEVFATILGMLMNCFNAREGLVTFPTVQRPIMLVRPEEEVFQCP